ncbi:uncharacterized protein LOC109790500 [Cajanus cajan]|uniref:Pectinesterase inhibitor domain-containing protein n=1 Tax=Cajanus cajan TaxID=3821 RepID=A0A151R332_CAJCA|nr:uncharacterized protein LOC109790500 [Cajanus cajan]KYP36875.1 hypothetical protein KK1_041977 [Cajanus cajan]
MNSSKLPLLMFTFSLILIFHAPLPTLATTLCEALCEEAKEDKGRCLHLLKLDPRILEATDNIEISKLILGFGLRKAKRTQKLLKEMMETNHSPLLAECATTIYGGMLSSFRSSIAELTVDSLSANYDAQVAGDGTKTCEKVLAEAKIDNPTFNALNKDVLLLSKLGYLATNKIPQTS